MAKLCPSASSTVVANTSGIYARDDETLKSQCGRKVELRDLGSHLHTDLAVVENNRCKGQADTKGFILYRYRWFPSSTLRYGDGEFPSGEEPSLFAAQCDESGLGEYFDKPVLFQGIDE